MSLELWIFLGVVVIAIIILVFSCFSKKRKHVIYYNDDCDIIDIDGDD